MSIRPIWSICKTFVKGLFNFVPVHVENGKDINVKNINIKINLEFAIISFVNGQKL